MALRDNLTQLNETVTSLAHSLFVSESIVPEISLSTSISQPVPYLCAPSTGSSDGNSATTLFASSHPLLEALQRRPLKHKLQARYKLVKSNSRILKRGVLPHAPDVSSSTTSSTSGVPGTKRALLIGINYKDSNMALRGCVNDVINVHMELTNKCGYDDSHIVILTDSKYNSLRATRQNIIFWIRKMVKETKAGDMLFVHYSGHGSQVRCMDGDEDNNECTPGMDDVIVPCDFQTHYPGNKGLITDDELRKELVEPLPKGAKLRVFFDCCCSGTALDLPLVYKDNEKYILDHDITLACDDCLLISGCRDDQTSDDAYINNQFSGALTWGLLKALETSRHMPMTWKDMFFLVRVYLAQDKYEQIPALSVGAAYVGSTPVDL